MRLIIGLGNPGGSYQNTRHNAGLLVLDKLQKTKLAKDFVMRKSGVFMNNSGNFVRKLVSQYKLRSEDLYIVHDDLDIPLGSYKIQFGRGPKDHNGILDIENKLGTKDFWRVRVGVDNRSEDKKPLGEKYVLQNFSDEETEILNKTIKEVVKKLFELVKTQ